MNAPPPEDWITELFHAHGRALLLYARQWVGPAAAEDVVQRAFVRLIAASARPAEPKTWLYRCVRNEAVSAWRSERRRDRRERASAAAAAPPWFVARPEDRIDAAAAEAALRELPADQREVIALRVWSGLTLAQTAEVTGLAVSSVHHHFHAGLAALRRRLESPCGKANH